MVNIFNSEKNEPATVLGTIGAKQAAENDTFEMDSTSIAKSPIGQKSEKSLDDLLTSIVGLIEEVQQHKKQEEVKPGLVAEDAKGILLDCFIRQVNSAINMLQVLDATKTDELNQLADVRDAVIKSLGYQEVDKESELAIEVAKEINTIAGVERWENLSDQTVERYIQEAREIIEIIGKFKRNL